jgi:hypothetical protein
MPKRSSKPSSPEDANETAFRVLREATEADDGKNPAAVALGRLGGKKGGPARAAKLSAKKRAEIARKAARARWRPQE